MIRQGELESLKGRRIIAAMSGGVDSSVAAALLKEAGAEVIGVFLHVWDYSRDEVARHGSCCATEDAYDARRVADHLGIAFYSMDMRDAFRRDVIDPFIAAYESGRTPNPCERCNRYVKFGALLDAADRLDADYVATGHYVQRHDDESGVRLFRGADPDKDQSYFLATTSAGQACRILFPVGHMQKAEVRRHAMRFGLPTADKRESQDICFIPAGDRAAFLQREGALVGLEPGAIVDDEGRVLGRHLGIANYTIGQRRGLGLSGGPWHVVAIDGNAARVVVAHPEDANISGVAVGEMAWIRKPGKDEPAEARVRYKSEPAPCRISQINDRICVEFDEPHMPTAPGQVAAFYSGNELLGGGIIQSIQNASA